jgi:hypothetical protein
LESLGFSLQSQPLHTTHIDDVKRLLEEGLRKLPSTKLTASEVLNSTSDPQRNRRLDLACRYYAQFGDWPLPMDDPSIELLKLRLRHASEQIAIESFEISQTVSPMVHVLNDLWHRNSQAWLKERATIELFSQGPQPL